MTYTMEVFITVKPFLTISVRFIAIQMDVFTTDKGFVGLQSRGNGEMCRLPILVEASVSKREAGGEVLSDSFCCWDVSGEGSTTESDTGVCEGVGIGGS